MRREYTLQLLYLLIPKRKTNLVNYLFTLNSNLVPFYVNNDIKGDFSEDLD